MPKKNCVNLFVISLLSLGLMSCTAHQRYRLLIDTEKNMCAQDRMKYSGLGTQRAFIHARYLCQEDVIKRHTKRLNLVVPDPNENKKLDLKDDACWRKVNRIYKEKYYPGLENETLMFLDHDIEKLTFNELLKIKVLLTYGYWPGKERCDSFRLEEISTAIGMEIRNRKKNRL